MASGDTKLTICSDAMLMLGAASISSFSEGTDEAQIADRLYDDIRDTLIMQYPYSWSIKKVKLAQLIDNPINEWKYRYALPGDILGNPKAVFITSAVGGTPARDFEIYGTALYADYEEVWIDYQYQPEPAQARPCGCVCRADHRPNPEGRLLSPPCVRFAQREHAWWPVARGDEH
jgi:hypothetical protein